MTIVIRLFVNRMVMQKERYRNKVMDRWEELFRLQAELAEQYKILRPVGFYAQEPVTRCTMWTRALIHEACELDDELNWKPWKNPKDLDANRERRLDETADLLHFLLQLALDQGFTADELFGAYQKKRMENQRRQYQDPAYRNDGSIGDEEKE
jgi:dimeric dUTPase (all-alpha-NTP-PPase superfamily)